MVSGLKCSFPFTDGETEAQKGEVPQQPKGSSRTGPTLGRGSRTPLPHRISLSAVGLGGAVRTPGISHMGPTKLFLQMALAVIFKILFRENGKILFRGKITPMVILQDDFCLIL